ncbi:MAG: helix-turn-helix transcriptional regulator, partial [Mucinivorans sp.]
MLSFIGKIITQLREENELTIEMLSDRTGITIEKLKDIEGGLIIPSVGVMIKISRALGARLGTLLDGHESSGAVVSRAKEITPSENLTSTRTGANRHMEF